MGCSRVYGGRLTVCLDRDTGENRSCGVSCAETIRAAARREQTRQALQAIHEVQTEARNEKHKRMALERDMASRGRVGRRDGYCVFPIRFAAWRPEPAGRIHGQAIRDGERAIQGSERQVGQHRQALGRGRRSAWHSCAARPCEIGFHACAPRCLARTCGSRTWTHAGAGEWPVILSTPERAILELLDEVPQKETFHQADMLMDGLVGNPTMQRKQAESAIRTRSTGSTKKIGRRESSGCASIL